MRYRYRVRLFYSIVFLIIGLVIGYKLAGYDLNMPDFKSFIDKNFIERTDIEPSDKQIASESEEEKIADGKYVGIILPEQEAKINKSIELALMGINSDSKEKFLADYETAGCSEVDVKRAISNLKSKNVGYAYGIFCDVQMLNAINEAKENKIVLLTFATNKNIINNFDGGLAKVTMYSGIRRETSKFLASYKIIYKAMPDAYDSISYDAIRIIDLMTRDKIIMDYEGVLGLINVEEKGKYAYIIILDR